jgi:hypothetical protein
MTPRQAARLGTVTLDPPGPVVAGSYCTWTLTLTVGTVGIDEGGTIKIAQRFASDGEPPQFDQPNRSGYCTITTTGQARLRPRFDRKAQDRPWMQAIVVDVYDGSLAPGDKVTLVMGDASAGSPGIRAQTFQESAHEFRVFVDPTNACVTRPVEKSPKFPIVADTITDLVCIVPTDAVVGQPAKIFIKGQDKWGNPTPVPKDLKLVWKGTGEATIGDRTITFRSPGSGVVEVQGQFSCRSNPITARATAPKYQKLWGDLHAQSDATVGTGSEVEYFAYARDVAALDFCSHQANDFQVTGEDWKRLNDVVRRFHSDGAFVVFPGWEWSGNSTAGGDRNVWFFEEGGPIFRSSHWQVPEIPEDDQSPADTAQELFDRVRKHCDLSKTMLGAHVGGRFADIRLYFDQELGPLVELVSCWGVFEWMLWDAFDKGYVVGVMCNSDGHKGRPGAEGPGAGQFGIGNGLTCALAESRTRQGIWNALKARRCYGTSGPRIDLSFEIDGQPMGTVRKNASAVASVFAEVKGTAPIESLELFKGKQVIQSVRPPEFSDLTKSNRIRLSWRGSRIRGRGRRVTWDGSIKVEGAKIRSATTFAFDTPIDGITKTTDTEVTFISQTTGDTDGIDLILDNATSGKFTFTSKAGNAEVDLSELTNDHARKTFDFGGLGIQLAIERYPEKLTETSAKLEAKIDVPSDKLPPFFVKVTQTDGHMAWSSPIYLQAK